MARIGTPITRRRTMATTSEGIAAFRGHRTWYQVVGELPATSGKLPLLVLHGGPGFPHDYLEDLARLADDGRPVVFYDQIGCGKSDHPDDDALWTMDTFVEEVAAVRDALGLDQVHLFGHSWGGWLALEYALGRPSGLASLVLASTCASLPAFAAETRRLKESLPADVQETIDRHEAEGTTDDPAYQEATMAYYTQWVCRLDPFPDHVMRSFTNVSEDVYATMQGPEWNVTGILKDWDVTARLGELDLPVLVTSGRHDEMTPAIIQPLVDGIRGAEHVLFQQSSHLAMSEEPDRYREVLESFLGRVEAAGD
jgi:proline-specific peptidase